MDEDMITLLAVLLIDVSFLYGLWMLIKFFAKKEVEVVRRIIK